ncbi:MAG: endopeptidase La [Gammaproteobacteria bacterium]|nr:endopeptidase La [Gammaproteobacteria bacterium]
MSNKKITSEIVDAGMQTEDSADSPDTATEQGLILPNQNLPERLLLLPIFERPFFPAQVQPLIVDEEPWSDTFAQLQKMNQHLLGLSYAGDSDSAADTTPAEFARIGCVVRLHNVVHSNGKIQFIAQGLQRFRINQWIHDKPPFAAEVTYPDEAVQNTKEIKAYAMALIQVIKELIPLNPLYNEELKNFLNHFNLNEPSPLADFAAAITTAPGTDLQGILDTVALQKRMEKVLVLLHKELEVARLQSEIRSEVEQKMTKHQREFFLREELKVIQRELGIAKDDRTADIDEFKQRMEKADPPEHVTKRFDEEITKMSILETGSPEYGVTRNYVDWLSSLPWGIHSSDNYDLDDARTVLDRDHAGLSDIKDRILEFLAMGSFRGEVGGSILLFVGPPGVGKTSIGKSIAECLGREFYRFSVGGMRDEAEIKGHRRTYIGAMPGKLVQALKQVQVSNPVIMLDEIDKMGASYNGDPASAMLEVLDPEQNSEFLDHYLDVRVDLSNVLFVCTANQLDTIPKPLLDRMDVIRLAGYITAEKLEIARRHLWPRLLKRNKVKASQVKISNSALRSLIEGYAREAGVRGLEKLLHRVLRKSIVKLLEGEQKLSITGQNLVEYVGEPVFRGETQIAGVGVVTGLAWTAMGGATLPIEATEVHTKDRGLKLTGQLGKVMNESAQIAHSYVTSNADYYGVEDEYFMSAHMHVHVPEGATPKDGPSAGVTMVTAMLSLALDKPIRKHIAMTGEITLTGEVLAVGGIREKLIAARRAGIKEVLLPESNERDVHELPEYITENLEIHFAQTYDDVFDIVFG